MELARTSGEFNANRHQRGRFSFRKSRHLRVDLFQRIGYGRAFGQIENELVLASDLAEKTEELNGDLHGLAAMASGRKVATYGRLR